MYIKLKKYDKVKIIQVRQELQRNNINFNDERVSKNNIWKL